MPTCISELGVGEVSDETLRELSNSVSVGDTLVLSHIRKLRMEDVYQIYRMANQ